MSGTTSDRGQTEREEDGYAPIGDYALIGDCRTAALVSRCGSIDWLCLPHFSGSAVFAALLDRRRGGRFEVRPAAASERRYIGRSNVLETTFRTDAGAVRVIDLMPVPGEGRGNAGAVLEPEREVLRIVEGIAGEVEIGVLFELRPDYARGAPPRLRRRGALGWACQGRGELLLLHADLPLAPTTADADAVACCPAGTAWS